VRALPVFGAWALLSVGPLSAQQAQPLPTWAYVEAVDGQNVMLENGSILRLGAQTAILKADGSAGTRQDIQQGAKIVFKSPQAGALDSIQVFPPPAVPEVYLYDLPPQRGGASGAPMPAEGKLWPKSIATLRASYQRQFSWRRFDSGVLYEPMKAEGAPTSVVFTVVDEVGDALLELALAAGETGHISLSLPTQTSQRLSLQVRPVGEGELRQEWCWWLDPHFVASQAQAPRWTISLTTTKALVEALAPALANAQAGKVAVASFNPVRVPDEQALRDLQDDLFVALGQKGSAAARYDKRMIIGQPLSDADRGQLKKLGATSVLVGSVSERAEGTVVNAVLLNVDSGAIVGAATAKQ